MRDASLRLSDMTITSVFSIYVNTKVNTFYKYFLNIHHIWFIKWWETADVGYDESYKVDGIELGLYSLK